MPCYSVGRTGFRIAVKARPNARCTEIREMGETKLVVAVSELVNFR